MKNGELINVDNMTETHAKNSLKLLINRVQEWKKAIQQSKPKEFCTGEIALEDEYKYQLYQINPELTCECDEISTCQQCFQRMDYLR